MARAGIALVIANARYWPTVAPVVRAQLHRWERHARAIGDPELQAIALQKLHEERFNAEVAATLATLAPHPHRQQVTEAIVAFEVMYDYLDGLTEQPAPDPLRAGHQLFRAFTDALTPDAEPAEDYYSQHPRPGDGGYLKALRDTVRRALAQLPAAAGIAEVAQRSAARCAEAQVRNHAAPRVGSAQLQEWASSAAVGSGLEWREFLAGSAASVLAVHALIAAAAHERTTREQAVEIDTAYLSIAALSTMLDSLVDYKSDLARGEPSHLRFYENHEHLAQELVSVARHAAARARTLPNGSHHVMTLVGVVAYYTSAPTGEFAAVTERIHRQLRPLITPTLAVMHTWRLAKRIRQQWRAQTREVTAAKGTSTTIEPAKASP